MNVVSTHPRLFLTPGIITTLKARAAKPTSRWDTLISLCARSGEPSWDIGIPNHCLAYVVTGDPKYAANAYILMQESMAAGLGQISGDSYYQCRNYFPSASLVYDWTYAAMTPMQRATLQADIEMCADAVWPETNPSRATGWAIADPGSNYYHGFMTTLMAGLALYGDSPKAQGYIDNAMNRWNTVILPYLNTQAAGGYLYEGTNYGVSSLRSMLWYLLAQSTATDSPLLIPTSGGWVTDATNALIKLTTPDLLRIYPGGDQPQSSGRPINDYDRGCLLIAAFLGSGPAKVWLDTVSPNPDQQRNNAWEEFLFYPEEATSSDYTKGWSTYYKATGAGLIQSRSDWSPSATQVTFQCGITTESHQNRNQGHFMLFKSDWLAAQAGLFSKSGLDQLALDANCITVDGQPQVNTQGGCALLVDEDAPSYTYAKGDLAAAYPNQLNNYARELFFLKPGYLLVRDALVPTNPTSQVTFHLQTLVLPTPAINGFNAAYAKANLFGVADAPLPTFATVTKSPDQTVPTYRVDWSPNAKGGFLVALEAAPPTQAKTTAAPFSSAASTVRGFILGGTYVAWASVDSPSFATPGPGPHYLIGFKPNTPYLVGSGSTAITITTSAAGVLAWNSNLAAGGVINVVAAPIAAPLTITGISPSPAITGNLITITGTGFTSGVTLNWGGVVYNPTILSPTQMTFTAPTVGALTAAFLKAVLGSTTAIGPTLAISPIPPPAKAFAASGSLTQNSDGTFSGNVVLTPTN